MAPTGKVVQKSNGAEARPQKHNNGRHEWPLVSTQHLCDSCGACKVGLNLATSEDPHMGNHQRYKYKHDWFALESEDFGRHCWRNMSKKILR